jgi:L-alanine-DL-glutamate epimerase-like enolase superfamily enzyme
MDGISSLLFSNTIFSLFLLIEFQLGPEKGVTHLATAAIVNALWDLWAKMEGKVWSNLWKR